MHTHLVFSTKNRQPLIMDTIRANLHAYVSVVLQDIECPASIINSVDDHIHVLFLLGRTRAVSEVVEKVKTASSKWMKRQGDEFAMFSWQTGYGVFSVSESQSGIVQRYIARQAERHRKTSFQAEYRAFLERHRVAYDERYVWD
ncbi:MAG: IS200/IS605 family transposase [Planctomycetes bacterium]|nr:IS200/IS605 family transposase [Planctomycetota bacterium]